MSQGGIDCHGAIPLDKPVDSLMSLQRGTLALAGDKR